MQNTIPKKPITEYKRTKIVATYGPSTGSYEQVLAMIEAGANAIRLNFSHGTHEGHAQAIAWVRKASKAFGKPVAIIQDLQGPKIRLGDFEGVLPVVTGQSLRMRYGADYEREGVLPIQYDLSKKVKRGERLYLFDGKVRSTITSVKDGIVHIRIENDGILLSRKGINLPDTDFTGDIITEKDKRDIVFGAEHDVDYVALSFVHSSSDIAMLKKQLRNLGSDAKVIAKVETRKALENLEPIVEASDAIMVARGDLAIEASVEEVPIAQRKMIGLGRKYSTPIIIATQMLASMTETPEPTRAEAGDIATAVILGVDAVMLSDETASGKYPLEAIAIMKRIILYTEANATVRTIHDEFPLEASTRQGAISKAVISLATDVKAVAIVAETKSGATAYKIAAYRPDLPIIAVTSTERVAQQLAITYGIKSFVREDKHEISSHIATWLRKYNVLKKGDIVVMASGAHPGVVGATDTIKVRILE
jgi:pyruvate kinase